MLGGDRYACSRKSNQCNRVSILCSESKGQSLPNILRFKNMINITYDLDTFSTRTSKHRKQKHALRFMECPNSKSIDEAAVLQHHRKSYKKQSKLTSYICMWLWGEDVREGIEELANETCSFTGANAEPAPAWNILYRWLDASAWDKNSGMARNCTKREETPKQELETVERNDKHNEVLAKPLHFSRLLCIHRLHEMPRDAG